VKSESGKSSSVSKAFSILDELALRGDAGASLLDVARHLHVSKSTAHRYLVTMEELGKVERDEKGRFHLGIKLFELAGSFLSNNDLRNQSAAILDELAGQTNETIHLGVPSEIDVVYIAKINSSHSIQMHSSIGMRVPMYSTALGKAILAHAPAALLEEVVRHGLAPRTPHTIVSVDALNRELARVRERGFSVDAEENEMGLCCIGGPIFNLENKVIGALSASAPVERMTKERRLEFGAMVRDASYRVSQRMGYSRPVRPVPSPS
jgi:DNA-binding IclR family transcriptional regulator